jgi:uncharacterized protein
VIYLSGTAAPMDRDRAVRLFRAACEEASARGCMRLGEAYHAGIAATPGADAHAEELDAHRRACDAGANLGCVAAGRAFVEGHGTGKDPTFAATLFAKVCARGNAEACLELGRLHQRGEGAPRSPERALALYRKACALGLDEACLHASPKGDERSPRE